METVTIKHHFHGKKFKPWQWEFWTTLIIKIKTNDKYYHTSFQIDNDYWEALLSDGVVKSNTPSIDPTYSIIFIVPKDETFNKMYNYLSQQKGKKYDLWSVLRGFFGRKENDVNRWWCSELNSIFFKFYMPNLPIKTNVSPKDLRMLCEAFKRGVTNRYHVA